MGARVLGRAGLRCEAPPRMARGLFGAAEYRAGEQSHLAMQAHAASGSCSIQEWPAAD